MGVRALPNLAQLLVLLVPGRRRRLARLKHGLPRHIPRLRGRALRVQNTARCTSAAGAQTGPFATRRACVQAMGGTHVHQLLRPVLLPCDHLRHPRGALVCLHVVASDQILQWSRAARHLAGQYWPLPRALYPRPGVDFWRCGRLRRGRPVQRVPNAPPPVLRVALLGHHDHHVHRVRGCTPHPAGGASVSCGRDARGLDLVGPSHRHILQCGEQCQPGAH
mmetsp:Transcript_2812/g.6566  ORF Transcript_2812/g.6566 Transcript_2812/m.6566 type:complete len:221 (-) Transcript_2812:952-1614(-)